MEGTKTGGVARAGFFSHPAASRERQSAIAVRARGSMQFCGKRKCTRESKVDGERESERKSKFNSPNLELL
jgi:hypothetical protein